MTTTYEDVLKFLGNATLTVNQQNLLVRVLNARMKQVRSMKKVAAIAGLRVGQKVTFRTKGGYDVAGEIQKVMRTNCWVLAEGERWYCPSTCLTPIT